MRTLANMVGEIVIARIPLLDADGMMLLKIHAVEAGGLWLESQDLTNGLMEAFNFFGSSTTLLVFVPFDKIDFIIAATDSLALSESAFGL
jgi:hypothetical protein